jgi:16S rRNA (guanine966-N2)-methyltransferase
LRIIGGAFRGRKVVYSGDPRTRPMKDRVREAVFNLVGPRIVGMHAVDLFAGTGAIGLEALSRGAARATFIERHFPTAAVLRENIASLEAQHRCQVMAADAFYVVERRLAEFGAAPWAVFVSPPFALYEERRHDMLGMINNLSAHAPNGSILVLEADQRLDFSLLPRGESWDVREYPPAIVGICEISQSAT